MNTNKNYLLMLLLSNSCSIHVIAQTDYYYYKGKRIPLTVNDDKVCVSIPKDKGDVSNELLKNINVVDTIKDAVFDIAIIQQSDLKLLTASKSWEKGSNYILLSPSFRTKEGKEVFLTPYLNVRLKGEQDYNLLSLYAERYGLRIVKRNSFLPLWYLLSISQETGKNALDIANELWESGDFAASAPDLSSYNLVYCCNDSEFNKQWGLYNRHHTGIDLSICNAWNYSTGKNVKIAILDSGVDQNHDDLRDNIIRDLSYNTETGLSPYYANYDNHGTHCAGIAAALKDNDGYKIAGVAPDAKIISIYNSLIIHTDIQEQLADGIMWAYENGADIISNSWGLPTQNSLIDEAIQKAIKYGRQGKGCVIVFATGNDSINSISYPANCNDTILAVGAIDSTGIRAVFSQYGTELDLVAPGEKIWSTFSDNRSGHMSGTSMACPHVAGVAALILERNPELTVTQVNSIICHNAKKISEVNFNVTKPDGSWNEEYGYGLVDAYSSVINTPTVAYIQNDTITGTEIISADKIYVGKNVTDTKEYGDVILGQGDITLKAGYIKIKNSTTVPLGTKLKIENQ